MWSKVASLLCELPLNAQVFRKYAEVRLNLGGLIRAISPVDIKFQCRILAIRRRVRMAIDWMFYNDDKHMILYASKLAACAGMHKYTSQESLREEFLRMMGRNAGYVSSVERGRQEIDRMSEDDKRVIDTGITATYANATDVVHAIKSLTTPKETVVALPTLVVDAIRGMMGLGDEGLQSPTEEMEREMANLPEAVKREIDTAIHSSYETLSAARDAFAVLVTPKVMTTEMPVEVVDFIRSAIHTRHGCQQEDVIRKAISQKLKKDVAVNNRFTSSAKPLMTIGGVDVFLGGRHDGMVDGRIIEIKTRQYRFLGVPIYERIQAHAYMHIYGTRESTLVESYNGDQKDHDIEFDDDLWSSVVSETRAFVESLLADI